MAKDPAHALAGIRELVSFVVADLSKAKRAVPKPLGVQTYVEEAAPSRKATLPRLAAKKAVKAATRGRTKKASSHA